MSSAETWRNAQCSPINQTKMYNLATISINYSCFGFFIWISASTYPKNIRNPENFRLGNTYIELVKRKKNINNFTKLWIQFKFVNHNKKCQFLFAQKSQTFIRLLWGDVWGEDKKTWDWKLPHLLIIYWSAGCRHHNELTWTNH